MNSRAGRGKSAGSVDRLMWLVKSPRLLPSLGDFPVVWAIGITMSLRDERDHGRRRKAWDHGESTFSMGRHLFDLAGSWMLYRPWTGLQHNATQRHVKSEEAGGGGLGGRVWGLHEIARLQVAVEARSFVVSHFSLVNYHLSSLRLSRRSLCDRWSTSFDFIAWTGGRSTAVGRVAL